jgi:hypothetical protein
VNKNEYLKTVIGDKLITFCTFLPQFMWVSHHRQLTLYSIWDESAGGGHSIGLPKEGLGLHVHYCSSPSSNTVAHGDAVGWGTAPQAGRSWVWFLMVPLELFLDSILPAALCPVVDSASNRNEYQEYFLGGKGIGCIGLTILPPSCSDCLEIRSCNLLEPSGPVQACAGIVLPIALTFHCPS